MHVVRCKSLRHVRDGEAHKLSTMVASTVRHSPRLSLAVTVSIVIAALLQTCPSARVSAFQGCGARQSRPRHRHTGSGMMTRQSVNNPEESSDNNHQISRRTSFQQGMRGLIFGALLLDTITPQHADAAMFGGKERRQLDYCLVNLLRVSYWAESLVQGFTTTEDEEKRKQLYLEARLGAKALVTGKVGGGATNRVYQLSTLQFRGCLEDIAYYGKSRKVSDLTQDLLESIAAVVEFDGLETTTDPSPRSSLTLSMYTPKKASYVQRLLSERVIPISKQLFNSFDPDVRQRCETYVATTYPNEVPKSPDDSPDNNTL